MVVIASRSVGVPLGVPVLEMIGILAKSALLHAAHVVLEDSVLLLCVSKHPLLRSTDFHKSQQLHP